MIKKQQHSKGNMLRKTGHLILGVLLFVSTTSMTVSVHYCNHHVYDIGILTTAESCCMPDANAHHNMNHDHCITDTQQKGHCEDETMTVDRVDDFVASAFRLDLTSPHVSDVPLLPVLLHGLPVNASSLSFNIPVRDHAPPGITVEPSFLQSFLF